MEGLFGFKGRTPVFAKHSKSSSASRENGRERCTSDEAKGDKGRGYTVFMAAKKVAERNQKGGKDKAVTTKSTN